MADWLFKPWIEKAISSFYEKDIVQPKFARAQIIQFNKIPSENCASAEALLNDKWMYAKAIFTPQAIEEFERSPSNICEFSLCDIKGGLIFLNDYRVVPHVDYAKGVWEHLLIVNKFTFKGCEKSSQFGSELINSAAHTPFQVRIRKHFQLKQLAELLQKAKNRKKLTLNENKAFDIKAITESFEERHHFPFISDEQQKLLDEIPEWRNDFCPPSTLEPSSSLITSLPSKPISHQYNDNPPSSCVNNDPDFSLNELSSNGGQFGLYYGDDDDKCIRITDASPLSFEAGYRSNEDNDSLLENYLLSESNTVPKQVKEQMSEPTELPSPVPCETLFEVLDFLEQQSDSVNSKKGKKNGSIVEEGEEVEDWTEAAGKDKIRNECFGRCSDVEISQDLKARDMVRGPTNTCVEQVATDDQGETFLEDTKTCDSRKRTVNRAVNVNKGACHSGEIECENQAADENMQVKDEAVKTTVFEESQEQYNTNYSDRLTIGSIEETHSSSWTGLDDDGGACSAEGTQYTKMSDTNLANAEEICLTQDRDEMEKIDRHDNVTICDSQIARISDATLLQSNRSCALPESSEGKDGRNDATTCNNRSVTISDASLLQLKESFSDIGCAGRSERAFHHPSDNNTNGCVLPFASEEGTSQHSSSGALQQPINDYYADYYNDDQDKDIVICSDESEEFEYSPKTVAKYSVLKCIYQSDINNKISEGIHVGRGESSGNMVFNLPLTVDKENVLRCFHHEMNTDADSDVMTARNQSKLTLASPKKSFTTEFADVTRAENSFQSSLTDSELAKAYNSSEEKENLSCMRLFGGNDLKGQKESRQFQLSTSKTSMEEQGPYSIPFSSARNYCPSKIQTPTRFASPERYDENSTSWEDTIKEVECLVRDPGNGIEKGAVSVAKNTGFNTSKDTKDIFQRQTRRLSNRVEKVSISDTRPEKDEISAQDRISRTTVVQVTNKTETTLLKNEYVVKGAHDVDKVIKMLGLSKRTLHNAAGLVGSEGGLKRKRLEEVDKTSVVRKSTVSFSLSTSSQHSTKRLKLTKDKNNHGQNLNGKFTVEARSQAFAELSYNDHVMYSQQDPIVLECSSSYSNTDNTSSQAFSESSYDDHVMYSQQDPLVLELSSSSENTDNTSSQEGNNINLSSSPILLPSPPDERKSEQLSGVVSSSSQNVRNVKAYQCTNEKVTVVKPTERTAKEALSVSEAHELSSPEFISLPSYQIPASSNTKCIIPSKKQETTTNNTQQSKNNPIIISDSEDEEEENGFTWFCADPRTW